MEKDFSQQKFDVIVIGSGISGMAAANDLAKNGYEVLVLQANDYIGGRMKSQPVKLHDNAVFNFQYGANWIHGKSKQNPLTQLFNMIPDVKLIETDDQKTITYDQNGKQADKEVDKEENQYQKIIDELDKHENISVYDAIKKINPSKLNNKYFMYHISNDLQFETSATINDLSAESGQDDQSFKGQDFLVTSRFQAFPQYLSQHKNIKVLLNKKVLEVNSNSSNSSSVKCLGGLTYHSKKVIIAVPLGVLKKETIKFNPKLPSWKCEAIENLHMGNVCKVLIIPKKNLKISDKEQYIGVVANDVNKRGAATYFLNLVYLAKIQAYMTFGLGPNADEIENMPEADLKALISKRMSLFSDSQVNPQDFNIIRSSWKKNENFGGAYTYGSVHSKPKHWQNMGKPIFSSGWYFCGEHTNSKYRGTVHGAYLSGIHTSKYIDDEVSEHDWKYADKS